MTAGLALDGLIALLLVATIVYAAMLNRRLQNIRNGRAELEATIAEFAQATARAEAGVARLRQHAESETAELDRRLERARAAVDELGFLVERAEALGGRLEAGIRGARDRPAPPAAAPSAPEPATGAEDELLHALQSLR